MATLDAEPTELGGQVGHRQRVLVVGGDAGHHDRLEQAESLQPGQLRLGQARGGAELLSRQARPGDDLRRRRFGGRAGGGRRAGRWARRGGDGRRGGGRRGGGRRGGGSGLLRGGGCGFRGGRWRRNGCGRRRGCGGAGRLARSRGRRRRRRRRRRRGNRRIGLRPRVRRPSRRGAGGGRCRPAGTAGGGVLLLTRTLLPGHNPVGRLQRDLVAGCLRNSCRTAGGVGQDTGHRFIVCRRRLLGGAPGSRHRAPEGDRAGCSRGPGRSGRSGRGVHRLGHPPVAEVRLGELFGFPLAQVPVGQPVPDHLEGQEVLTLLTQDPTEAFHVGLEELAIAGWGPFGVHQTLSLQKADLGDGDVGELLAQQRQHITDREVRARRHSFPATR